MRDNRALAVFHDLAPTDESFRDAVLDGLARRSKAIPCRFLYDARGSVLFEKICATPEYYPTRTEIGILEDNVAEIAALAGANAQLVEFGSGASRKVRTLLRALQSPAAYIAIDISREMLRRAAQRLADIFPELPITAVCADYTRPLDLDALPPTRGGRRLGFFPGSTIGNFTPGEAVDFLAGCRHVVGADGAMLIGVDLQKDVGRLNAAYNDAQGVTAAFTLNLLHRINRELDGDFDVARFAHDAAYNPQTERVEICIRSLADQIVTVAGRAFRLAKNEPIHTEVSCKYTIDGFQRLAARAGFRPVRAWTDSENLFSLHYLTAG